MTQFCHHSDRPVSANVQHDIKSALANWIASSGRTMLIVEDDDLHQVLRIGPQNDGYKLPSRRSFDSLLVNICLKVIMRM